MVVIMKGAMSDRRGRDTVHRWEDNPLIDISDLEFKCSDIHNAGVVSFEGKTTLLVTIEHLSGVRSIHLARTDASGHFAVDPKPFISPSTDPKYKQHERRGVLDARVSCVDGVYYIVYNALGDHGYRLGLAKTDDFKTAERIGMISEPDTKAGALFPQKIKGRFARLERPCSGNSIWVTYSDDLTYWGSSELVICPRSGFWDANRIGIGPPPIKIKEGWLVLYYAAKDTSAGPIYRLGAVILDENEPTKVIGRAGIPILSPREDYERIGDIPNVVFATGAFIRNEKNLVIFYGAANSCICIGTTTVEDVVASCMESEKEY